MTTDLIILMTPVFILLDQRRNRQDYEMTYARGTETKEDLKEHIEFMGMNIKNTYNSKVREEK